MLLDKLGRMAAILQDLMLHALLQNWPSSVFNAGCNILWTETFGDSSSTVRLLYRMHSAQ
jgi:hypothetical protein